MNKVLDGKYIKRFYTMEDLRAATDERRLTGHAAVYNSKTRIGDMFDEIIEPNAFDSNTDLSDVALFVNHDMSKIPLARHRKSIPNSTMSVVPDDIGLYMAATVDTENNAQAKALLSAIDRRDIDGMSFAFLIDAETWEDLDKEIPLRRINHIAKVIEVSAVTFPAYKDTYIGTRSESLESDSAALEKAMNAVKDIILEKEKLKLKGRL